jgi:GntR family transcriptional regulator / MocR family aminotransferase
LERACVEPPVLLDRGALVPLTAQLSGQLREAVRDGRIDAGERLPSTRALAQALGVSRTVVTDAYAQLYAEGWLEGRHGSGTYVAEGASGATRIPGASGAAGGEGIAGPAPGAPDEPQRASRTPRGRASYGPGGPARVRQAGPTGSPVIDLKPGVPWAGGIDRAAWRRAWRRAGYAQVTPAPPPVADPSGLPELRAVLTGYLRRSRAVSCSAGEIVVTRGVANGLDLLAAALLSPGDRAGVEEPGWPSARSILAARGARVVPCEADDHGLVPEALPNGLRLVYTTPAHQTPLGGRLPVPRRQALLAWARRTGALVVEDDYDSEFRYDVAPLPALHSLDPGVVAYLGTTAKTLTPELGIGWLVAPQEVLSAVKDARTGLSDRTSVPLQHAAASLIECGDLERHVRRMRHEYARRRSAIIDVLGTLPPPARMLGDTAGMHVVLELPVEVTGAAAKAAQARGVAVTKLDRYFSFPGTASLHGLVLGYGGVTLPELTRGCEILREIIEPLLSPHGNHAVLVS